MGSYVMNLSESQTNNKCLIILLLSETKVWSTRSVTTTSSSSYSSSSTSGRDFYGHIIHVLIFNLNPVDIFSRAFWRSLPNLVNRVVLNCISCNRKRKQKSSPKNRVQYISVTSPASTPSPQLTSSSSSSLPATTSSSVSSSNSSQQNIAATAATTTTTTMAPNDSSFSPAVTTTTTTAVTAQPTAPSPGLVLFNSEEHSDIVFMVSNDSRPVWRFPAHSFIVENASPVFKAIVDSGGGGGGFGGADRTADAKQQHIKQINYCEPEIFYVILRHIYTNEITITSVSNALTLFTAANQFLLGDLCRLCLTFLYDNCTDETVLEMLSHFSQFSYLRPSYLTTTPPTTTTAAAADINSNSVSSSPIISRQASLQFSSNCDNILNELITRCYYTLDSEAVKILSSDGFINLEHDLIVKILSRDSLNIVSETTVFDCIKRWSCQQCTRQCKEMTADNKRTLLGKALYCTRYLTMTVDEFMRGPHSSDLLSDQERQALLARMTGDTRVPMPSHLTGRKLDVRRVFVEQKQHLKRLDELTSPSSPSAMANCPLNTGTTGSSSSSSNGGNAGIIAKKKSTSKKLLNGLGDLVICVIRLLD
ncbi:BTB/POZ domain-containing protein 6-B-like [Oppia nitens]|uniref:BTB/POZ domain-containing protein 6-B-like n=1 Tax=Oppia nitens TaxID=1686743 RepID=UPI0023DB0AB6|nr:BTB/POZ domain-containing protein 6-B-like [Oppia nitens]